MSTSSVIQGTVLPGYEPDFARGSDSNSQLCVYVGGERVIDLWGSAAGPMRDPDYGPDSLQNIFSSSKSIVAICVALLVQRGLLSYDDRIVEHWPEFGRHGKENVTVSDVLRHESGLASFSQTIKLADLMPDAIKENKIGRIVEEESQSFPPRKLATNREYHGITRGLILNEIVRRVDPENRTIGQFLRGEVSEPLDADVFIGLKKDELPRVSDVQSWSLLYYVFQSLVPKALGRKIEPSIFDFIALLSKFRPYKLLERITQPAPLDAFSSAGYWDTDNMLAIMNGREIRMGETPSINAHCSARGLAKLAGAMASKGRVPGSRRRLMSEDTWEKMHAKPVAKPDALIVYTTTNFTQGGVNLFGRKSPNPLKQRPANDEGFVGWMGIGGSVFQWHPELEIGFAYAPTLLHYLDMFDGKTARLQKAVVDSVKKLRDQGDAKKGDGTGGQ